MKMRIAVLLGVIVAALAIYFYVTFNESYSLSSQAKEYYDAERYEDALAVAEEAYALNHYNRMAFTILVQSKESLKWQQFIHKTDDYLKAIYHFGMQSYINTADRYRIKMMCEIVLENYKALPPPNRLLNENLIKRAKQRHDQVEEIYEELFGEE